MASISFSPSRVIGLVDENIKIDTATAFSQLYEETHVTVYRYVFGLLGGPQQDVEDITAETYVRAWKARHRFQGNQSAALGWLLVISKRLVIDRHRRHKVRGYTEDIDELSLAAPGQSPEDNTMASEQMRILWGLMQNLPNRQREMLVLRYILGWKVKEIGDHIGIPQNTVSVTIRRTLHRLRRDWPESAFPIPEEFATQGEGDAC